MADFRLSDDGREVVIKGGLHAVVPGIGQIRVEVSATDRTGKLLRSTTA